MVEQLAKNKMEREEIKLKLSDVKDIVYDDHEDWKTIQSEITGNWRHGDENSGVFERLSDGKFFRIDWRDSVKDECGFEDCNFGNFVAKEVFPEQVTITIYK